MRVYCTLFDSNYISRGLAMYHSLARHSSSFHLYIFAFNDAAFNILSELRLPNVTLITLQQFEDPELLKVKPTRSTAEYCWTCTPSTVLYVLNNFLVSECTYIDADLYFYNSPELLFSEMGESSIMITEHRFSPMYSDNLIFGRFCVQFTTFKNNDTGRNALQWWRERCLEWCYNYLIDGKFGDQGYLNDWETRFNGVHVLRHLGGGLAPWNVQQYSFSRNESGFTGNVISNSESFTPVFYHFHHLHFLKGNKIDLGIRQFASDVIDLFYKPYVKELDEHAKFLNSKFPGIDAHGLVKTKRDLRYWYLFIKRRFIKQNHVFDKDRFIAGQ